MLETTAFVRWANANVVTLFAHNELGHEAVEVETEDEGKVARCPLYPGLTCRDHLNVAVDIDGGMRGLVPKVPFVELCPNSWLVLPTGVVEAIPEDDQFVAAKIEARVKAAQKELGSALDVARGDRCVRRLAEAAVALEADDWHAALVALAGLAEEVREPPPSLARLVDERLAQIDEPVTWAFEELRDDDDLPPASKRTAVEALLRRVAVDVYGRRLPVVKALESWLASR